MSNVQVEPRKGGAVAAVAAALSSPASTRIWTWTYFGMCLTAFLSYAHNAILTPTIPLFIQSLGGTELTVGLVLAAFAVSSFSLRPFVGYLVDAWSVPGVLAVGTLLLAVAAFANLTAVLWLLAVISAIRGLGWAAMNTAGNTMLANVAPPARRGEAAGYYGLFQNFAGTALPAFGLWLLESNPPTAPGVSGGFLPVFLVSGVLGLGGTVIALWLTRSRAAVGRKAAPGAVKLELRTLVDKSVALPAVLLGCMMATHPAAQAFLPLYARQNGIEGVGWYYVIGGLTAIFMRGALGRVSDRWTRGISIAAGFVAALLGFSVLIFATTLPVLILGGILYSTGQSLVTPALMALAIDSSEPARRGTAMATYSAAHQVGMALGAPLWGFLIERSGYQTMYMGAIIVIVIGLVVVRSNWPGLTKRNPGLVGA